MIRQTMLIWIKSQLLCLLCIFMQNYSLRSPYFAKIISIPENVENMSLTDWSI